MEVSINSFPLNSGNTWLIYMVLIVWLIYMVLMIRSGGFHKYMANIPIGSMYAIYGNKTGVY